MKRILGFLFFIYQLVVIFPVFGIATAICGFIAVSISVLGYPSFASQFAGSIWGRVSVWVTLSRISVSGREKIKEGQSYVIVANHPSAFDILVVYGWIGLDFKWVIKKEVRKYPILGYSCHKMGHVFVDRSNTDAAIKSLQSAKSRIRDGVSIFFFPEGTRHKEIGQFKKGAFRMALDLELPILPVTIRDSEKIIPSKSIKVRPGHAEMIFHDPIETSDYNHENLRELVEKSHDIIMAPLKKSGK
ncbi:MAG: 1-acyl-sn-glycerol-3-phosphate acyltransferase [Calditrichaeota bacterium]|nr:MAG: 1-acyl-sn-glycerol-3-phosphate acyltransferase [Calditrichota bacterium]